MTKNEIIEKLEDIQSAIETAQSFAYNASDEAENIDGNCSINDVLYYAEESANDSNSCHDKLEDISSDLESLIHCLEGSNLEEDADTAIYDEMISELKRTTEEKLTSFEYALLEKERSLAELREEFNRLTEEIHNDLENLENEIKGDE